ncbi:ATP-grasp domain-containing protein [Candidatus Carsonella ruddii]|uniref:ATP-grasp domain-containing protein n=1 Tax=Carsonella ruddii TaxID=114186 RepID=UPI003D9A2650
MNLYEYESKKILKKFNLSILNSYLVNNFFYLNNKIYKIQVHSGYRKKNKGVVLINNYFECVFFFNKWKKSCLLKKKIKNFLIEDFILIEKELYFSLFFSNNNFYLILSEKGGIEIEFQKKINFLKLKINLLLISYSIFDYLSNCFFSNNFIKKIIKIFYNLYKIFFLKKILLIEINPLIINNKNIFILDCKIIIEKKNIQNFSEKISFLLKINYIQLKGKICCIVNGAGLALKTLDCFCYNNAKCFNFIDLSGQINDIQLNKLFNFILTKKIKILFINLFGGIVSCKKILNSILNYMYLNFNHKIIIRIDGSLSNFSKKKLIKFKNLIIIENLNDCIKKCIILSNV